MMSLQTIEQKTDLVNATLAELRAMKDTYPSHKTGVNWASVGSILDSYREGDISFDDAVGALQVKLE